MSLNPDLIRARCAEIDSSLNRLEEFRRLSREQFVSSQDTLDVACYRLLIAAGRQAIGASPEVVADSGVLYTSSRAAQREFF